MGSSTLSVSLHASYLSVSERGLAKGDRSMDGRFHGLSLPPWTPGGARESSVGVEGNSRAREGGEKVEEQKVPAGGGSGVKGRKRPSMKGGSEVTYRQEVKRSRSLLREGQGSRGSRDQFLAFFRPGVKGRKRPSMKGGRRSHTGRRSKGRGAC